MRTQYFKINGEEYPMDYYYLVEDLLESRSFRVRDGDFRPKSKYVRLTGVHRNLEIEIQWTWNPLKRFMKITSENVEEIIQILRGISLRTFREIDTSQINKERFKATKRKRWEKPLLIKKNGK